MATRAIYGKIIYVWIIVKGFFADVLVTRCFTYAARPRWQTLETARSHKGLGRKVWIIVKGFFADVLVTRCFTYAARPRWQTLETARSHKGLGRKMS